MKTKIMLVDDHPLFLEGLQYLLETYGIKVVGTAGNGREALEKARALKPDVILMDVLMPGGDGLEATRRIKAERPEVKIIMLTASEEDENLFEAIKAGASGYLLKSLKARELVDMLNNLEEGAAPLSSGLAARLLQEFRNNNTSAGMVVRDKLKDTKEAQLTKRQLEVLELVTKGKTYKEIGKVLGLSERTVKYHMERLLVILHLENRAQVIAYAAKKGLTGEEETKEI
ncbi:MAG TPA: response regulator transcription factor [Firmicutes bacterium]|jgi:DNA-binding NarL/FixJ family response regulator|nr:response regulator transcription factor [Bacillota bacterium]